MMFKIQGSMDEKELFISTFETILKTRRIGSVSVKEDDNGIPYICCKPVPRIDNLQKVISAAYTPESLWNIFVTYIEVYGMTLWDIWGSISKEAVANTNDFDFEITKNEDGTICNIKAVL